MRAGFSPVLSLREFYARPLERADAPAWLAYAALAQVRQHTSSTVETLADLLPIIERCNSDLPSSPIHFAVCTAAQRRLVATIGFHTVSPLNRSAEITYDVHPSHWGQGLGSACCQAAVAWGFERAGFVRIQATTLESNLASQRVLNKCGFAFEGKLRNYRVVRGLPRDFLLYSVVPDLGGHDATGPAS
jgi:ribosomal-protein-alanine N-acetyltransferase